MPAWLGLLRIAGGVALFGGAVGMTLFLRGSPHSEIRGEAAPQFTAPGAASPVTLRIPVRGVKASELIDTFSQARNNGARTHDAIDIPAPLGTPVLAAAPGTIEKLFVSEQGGLTIYQRSSDRRTIYYYAHLDRYTVGLAEWQVIAAGQVIGAVGYTGNADPAAPHLHFAVFQTSPEAPWYRPAQAFNPYPLLAGK